MTANRVARLHDVPVLVVAPDGPVLREGADALDLIAEAITQQVELVAVIGCRTSSSPCAPGSPASSPRSS